MDFKDIQPIALHDNATIKNYTINDINELMNNSINGTITIQFDFLLTRYYKNNGQHAEQIARYNLTGIIERADSKKHTEVSDILNIQLKSARATVGYINTPPVLYISRDKATFFGYIHDDYKAITIFDKKAWLLFCDTFAHVEGTEYRLRKPNNKKVMAYLNSL